MRLGILSSVSLLVLAITAPAFAGFEFVSPSAAPAASSAATAAAPNDNNNQALTPAAPEVPAAPAQIQSDTLPEPVTAPERKMNARTETPLAPVGVPLTPVVTDSDALSIESGSYKKDMAATAMPAPIRNVVDNLAPTATLPETDSTAPTPAAAAIANDGSAVQGFGRNVPLAIALQQIVPASYRYSFEKSVNPSTKISWSGGKPWKQVVADIARSNNMNVDIASNVVSFKRQSPMDTIASDSVIDSNPDSVQGMKLKGYAGQHVASTTAAPSAMPAPVVSAIYDTPVSTSSSSNTTMASSSSTRTPLASISDLPPAVMPLENTAPTPAPVATASTAPTAPEKSAFFDGMMDNGPAANGKVAEKKITTADNKPVDILDKVSIAAPSPAQTAPEGMPKPVDSVPVPALPMPAAPSGEPINITRQIDNSPVVANDLPAPSAAGAVPSEPPVSTSKAGLATTQEWVAHKGETLRQTLTSWSEQAGVSLVWSSEYDYPLQTDVRIQANYADTVRTLLAGFSKAQPRPIGRLFKNDKVGAQPVLIVETQRLTN